MPDLSDLIARAEAASGPDRELDLAIYRELHPMSDIDRITAHRRGLDAREGYTWDILGGAVVFERRDADGRCPFNGGYTLPFYTASIDAALTLLPEGFTWAGGDLSDNNVPWCCITADDTSDDYDCLSAATFCLALLSAILKARQASNEEARHD